MSASYTRAQKILHWLLAFLILFWLFVSGELVESAEGADKGFIVMFHSGGAIIILALTLWRFSLRQKNTVPTIESAKPWERKWGLRAHRTLYGLVLLMVLSGLLQGMFFEQDVRVMGLLNITIGHNETLMGAFHEVHEITALLLKLLIALHVLAALKHQFIDKQPMLKRLG